jgi:excinuclease ABC subunit B
MRPFLIRHLENPNVKLKKPIKKKEVEIKETRHVPKNEIPNVVIELEKRMRDAAEQLDFERAIALRDQIKKLNDESPFICLTWTY